MKEYRNIFREKTHEELIKLYGQFLEAEKLGYIPDNELGKIREEYVEYFSANVLMMIQFDLTHVLSDIWYANEKERMNV